MGRKDLEKRIYTSHLNNFVAKVIKEKAAEETGLEGMLEEKKALLHDCRYDQGREGNIAKTEPRPTGRDVI